VTAFLVVATAGLWFFTALMWRSVRREFVATHRPRLRVRAIQFDGFTNSEILPAWIYVANVGANPALNIRFDAVFTQRQGGTRKAPWIEKLSPSDAHGPKALKAGQRATYEPSTADFLLPFEAEEIRSTNRTLMLIGRIHYTDGISTERQTGFGWRYDSALGEFCRPKEEDEYNYED
jgi:hypothetical protein